MARGNRQVTAEIIQHLMWHGMRECGLFCDEEDFHVFTDKMSSLASHLAIKLYAYCLLSTHIHMVAEPQTDNLPEFMQRLGQAYAVHFNKKYELKGHVFSDRYWPIAVTNDRYLLMLSRYIHRNPSKAGMVKRPEDYRWSSCKNYLGYRNDTFLNTDTVLNHFRSGPQSRNIAIQAYKAYLYEDIEGDDLPVIKKRNGAWVYEDAPVAPEVCPPPDQSTTVSAMHWNEVVRIVNKNWDDLATPGMVRFSSDNAKRDATLWLSRRFAAMKWKELAEVFEMEPAAARIAAKRFQDRLSADGLMERLVRIIEADIAAAITPAGGAADMPGTPNCETPPISERPF